MSNDKSITLEQLFRFYRNLPHQSAAISELEADLKANGYAAAMLRSRPWFKTWSTAGKIDNVAPALQIIKEFEGFVPRAYPDPLSGGKPYTIGFGSTRHPDGTPVKLGDVVTLEQGNAMLQREVNEYAEKLALKIPYWTEMSDEQRSALLSFAYNLGPDFYGAQGFETISWVLKERKWGDVANTLLLYRNPGTSVEAGLQRRRIAEGKLWNLGIKPGPKPAQSLVFMPSSPFSTKLTRNIEYGEFALYKEVRRFDHQHQCQTALELAQFLEKVRTHFNKPIVITSGHRPPVINKSVGGASSSEHLYNAPGVGAVDFFVEGVDIYKVQDYCLKNWPYSVGKGAPKGFCHLGIRQGRPKVIWDY